jgi:hypothetical protein
MIFTLEALRARHGDCLMLHHGDPDEPQLIVVDGGPTGVYGDALGPRLNELWERIETDDPLPIQLLMVSHIDDDHIRGVLELSERLVAQRLTSQPYDIGALWLNALDDIVGNDANELAAGVAELPARVAEATAGSGAWEGNAQAVVASVPQAKKLRSNADGLGWPRNAGFEKFVIAPAQGGAKTKLGELELTIVAPKLPQLQALQADWKEKLERLHAAGAAEKEALAQDLDSSVYNLSSIVCLADLGGKRMLLTGDALGRNIVDGLRAAGELDENGRIEVDILKLPHHGSDRNVDAAFFDAIRAKHYVVSGDGKYHNPDPTTFQLISASRDDDQFAVHLTYRDARNGVGEELDAFFTAEKAAGRTYAVNYRDDAAVSLKVDLLDPLSY